MPTRKPAISVCIPVYNGERHLGVAIRSVLSQSFKNLELLIIDDSSTDNSLQLAKCFRDPRLRIIRNDHNLGMVGNFNKCVSSARGEFVCILPQDDIMLPERLQVQHDLMSKNSRIGYVHSASWIVDDNDRACALRKPFHSNHVWPGLQAIEKHAFGNFVTFPTVMVRRESFLEVGPFDPELSFALDWDMWLRIELAGYLVAYLARPLACYRFGSGYSSQTASAFQNPSWLVSEEFKVIRKTFSDPYVRARMAVANLGMDRVIAERICNSLVYWPLLMLQSGRLHFESIPQSIYWFLIARKLGLIRLTICSIALVVVSRLLQLTTTNRVGYPAPSRKP